MAVFFVLQVNQNHEGRYTCTPYNAQGTQGSSGPMDVLVRKPPVFTIEPDNMYQRKVGETVEMHCEAQETEGTQKPTIQWQRVSVCVHFYVQSYMHIYQDINFKVLNFLSLPKGSLNQPVKIYLLRSRNVKLHLDIITMLWQCIMGMEVSHHKLWALGLDGGDQFTLHSAYFTPWETAFDTRFLEGLVDTKASLNVMGRQ